MTNTTPIPQTYELWLTEIDLVETDSGDSASVGQTGRIIYWEPIDLERHPDAEELATPVVAWEGSAKPGGPKKVVGIHRPDTDYCIDVTAAKSFFAAEQYVDELNTHNRNQAR